MLEQELTTKISVRTMCIGKVGAGRCHLSTFRMFCQIILQALPQLPDFLIHQIRFGNRLADFLTQQFAVAAA